MNVSPSFGISMISEVPSNPQLTLVYMDFDGNFIFRSGNRAGERYMGVGEHEDEEFDQPEMDSFTIEF